MRRLLTIALCLIAAPSWAAITRNTSLSCGLDTTTCAYTVGSGSNRLLVVVLFGDAADNLPALTYNGVSMTSVVSGGAGNGSDRRIWMFYLLNPASGNHNIVATWGSGTPRIWMLASDYDGVLQSGQPDGSNSNTSAGTASLTAAVTVTASNSWMVAVGREQVGGTVTWTSGTTNELQGPGGLHLADSNGSVATGSVNDTATFGSANLTALIAASFSPDTGGVTPTLAPQRLLQGVGK